MTTFKKFALCIVAATISSLSYASIIELDALNPDTCRQQILKSTDEAPIIAAYKSDNLDGNSKEFMKKFELLAKQHPERTFFKWDVRKDWAHTTQLLCIQQVGFSIQPNIILLGVVKDEESGSVFMTSPLRLTWAGQMTLTEMNKFIDISDFDMKKAVLSQKNRN